MINGWIKLHRKLKDKGYYKKSEYIHLWLHLLLTANHRKTEFMWNNKIQQINEGQLLTGRKQLSKETGISQTTIERILKMLESEHQIGQQKTPKFRIITIVNWKNYQLDENSGQVNGQQTDNRRTTDGQQTDTYKNNKKDKKVKKGMPTPSLQEVKDYFKSKGYLESVAITAFDYYQELNWHDSKGKPVKNWKSKMIAVWMKEENKDKSTNDFPK